MIWWNAPRTLLLLALLLDWLGQLLILTGLICTPSWLETHIGAPPLPEVHGLWLVFCLLLYPLLGWLFGSYTVLRWRRLAFPVLLQRFAYHCHLHSDGGCDCSLVCQSGEEVWLVSRRAQLVWVGAATAWSHVDTNACHRRGLFLPEAPRLLLLASDDEIAGTLHAWSRVVLPQRLKPISPEDLENLLNEGSEPLVVALRQPALQFKPFGLD